MANYPGQVGNGAQIQLDGALVDAFLADLLGSSGQEALAEQVAHLLPFHWALPDRIAADLARLIRGLGGEDGLFDWLAGRSGWPRLVPYLYDLIELLDWHSADLAIVSALREVRQDTSLAPLVGAHLAPDTNGATLAGLAWAVEAMLGDGRVDEAVRLADGAADLLEKVARRASTVDPRAAELADHGARLRADFAEAARQDVADHWGGEAAHG